MKRLTLTAFFVIVFWFGLAHCAPAFAQTTDPATWPVCKLGAAPIAPGPAPKEAQVFKTKGGPVIMSEAGLQGAVKLIRCNLAPDVDVYRGADGDLRDLPSNQPFWPVGWDATPPTPLTDSVRNIKGDPGPPGPEGPQGPRGFRGEKGEPGRDVPNKVKHGHKKWYVVGGLAVAGAIARWLATRDKAPAPPPPPGPDVTTLPPCTVLPCK